MLTTSPHSVHTTEYLHVAQLHAASTDTATELLRALHMATQRFSEGLRWLSLRFPLSTRVVVRAVAVGTTLVTTAPDFACAYTLPPAFSRWAAGEGEDVGMDLLAASPVGPVTCSLRRQQLQHALETQDPSKGAVIKLRAQAERSVGEDEGGSTAGSTSGNSTGNSRGSTSGNTSGIGSSVRGEPQGTRDGTGGRALQSTWSLAGMSREEQLCKFVVVHVKLHRLGLLTQQEPEQDSVSAPKGHRPQSAQSDVVSTQLGLVAVAVVVVWLLVCVGLQPGMACLQALVLCTAAIVGRHHVMSSKAQHSQPASVPLHAWTVEILHAAVTQLVPDEPGGLEGGLEGGVGVGRLCNASMTCCVVVRMKRV